MPTAARITPRSRIVAGLDDGLAIFELMTQSTSNCRSVELTFGLMARADVQQADVYAAIAEYDDLGQEGFLEKYKMGKATSYLLRHEGKDYDSKAIFAAAHGHHPGLMPLAANEFSGGADDAANYLRRLGFEVYSSRGPTWARDVDPGGGEPKRGRRRDAGGRPARNLERGGCPDGCDERTRRIWARQHRDADHPEIQCKRCETSACRCLSGGRALGAVAAARPRWAAVRTRAP
jgi:hypothetical protein